MHTNAEKAVPYRNLLRSLSLFTRDHLVAAAVGIRWNKGWKVSYIGVL